MAKVLILFSVVVVVQLSSLAGAAPAETPQEVYFKTSSASVTPIMTYELRTVKKFPDPIPAGVEWPHLKQLDKVVANLHAKTKDKPKQDFLSRFQHIFQDTYRIAELLSFPLSETSLELANGMKELISIDDFSNEEQKKLFRPARYLDHVKTIQKKISDVVAYSLLNIFNFEYVDILLEMPDLLESVTPQRIKKLDAYFQKFSEDITKGRNGIAKKADAVRKVVKKQMEISKNLNELMKRLKHIASKLDNGRLKTEDKPKFRKALDELYVKSSEAIRIVRGKECRDAVSALEDKILDYAREQPNAIDIIDDEDLA